MQYLHMLMEREGPPPQKTKNKKTIRRKSCFIRFNRCKSTSCLFNILEVYDSENNFHVKSSWAFNMFLFV